MTLPPPLDPGSADPDPGPADPGPAVPDVPDAVLGWRTWRVGRRAQRRAELIAPLAGVPWPARRPMVASCGSATHAPPGVRCACGLHAASDPRVLEWGPSALEVLGVVALWGAVVEGARGWRASHAYPRLVVVGPTVPGEQSAAIARRYGVAVHRSDVAPRVLAAFLGADRPAADAVRYGPPAEVAALLADRTPEWLRRATPATPATPAGPPPAGPPVGPGVTPRRARLLAVARRARRG